MRLGRDLLSASSPKEPEPRQCLAPARSPLAQNYLQNVDRSNPLQCRAPSPQSTPTRLLDLPASKILTSTIFPLKTDRKSTEVGAQPFLNPDPPATLSRGDCGPGGSGATLLTLCRSRFLVVLIIQS